MRTSISIAPKKAYWVLLLLAWTGLASKGTAQDLHFSQFPMAPLHLNAAEAGAFQGEHRAFANYKSQWQSLGSGYRTFDLAFDTHLFADKWENSGLGIGGILYRDVAGPLNFGTTEGRLMLSYHTLTGEHTKLSAGFGGGYVQQSVDREEMKWGGQYDGTSYNPDIGVRAEEKIGSSGYWDLNSGLRFSAFSEPGAKVKNEGWKVDVGASAHHLHEPEQGFLVESGSPARKIPRSYTGYANGHLGLGKQLALRPSLLYRRQGPSSELMGSLMFRYMLKEGSIYTGLVEGAALSLGAHYRAGDAFVPALLLEFGPYKAGVSYDVNLSELSRSSQGRGGFEISFRFQNPNPFQKSSPAGRAKFL